MVAAQVADEAALHTLQAVHVGRLEALDVEADEARAVDRQQHLLQHFRRRAGCQQQDHKGVIIQRR